MATPLSNASDYYLLLFRDCFVGTQNWFRGGAAKRCIFFPESIADAKPCGSDVIPTTAAGAPGTRLSLLPLFSRDMRSANFGPYLRRENADAHLRPYPQLSSPHRVSPSANPTKQSISIGAARWIASLRAMTVHFELAITAGPAHAR
jgi:hypothetical protein